jgi:hypothetical protein
MSIGTSDGQNFKDDFSYWHDQIFEKPKRDFNAALEPHKAEYLANNPDITEHEVAWPKDHRGLDFLKKVNAYDRKKGNNDIR